MQLSDNQVEDGVAARSPRYCGGSLLPAYGSNVPGSNIRRDKFKQISGIVAGTARLFCRYAGEPSADKINPIYKSFYEADRIVRSDVVIKRFRKKQQLRAV